MDTKIEEVEIEKEQILVIKYEYTQPIPLEDYQKALSSINKQYNKYWNSALKNKKR